MKDRRDPRQRITDILEHTRRIAVFGIGSESDTRDHDIDVAEFLCVEGYEIVTIGPIHRRILPGKSYPSLSAVPDPVDLAAIFPGTPDMAGVVRQAVRRSVPTIWFQRGVSARSLAAEAALAGIAVVQNRCLREEHLARWMPFVHATLGRIPGIEDWSL